MQVPAGVISFIVFLMYLCHFFWIGFRERIVHRINQKNNNNLAFGV